MLKNINLNGLICHNIKHQKLRRFLVNNLFYKMSLAIILSLLMFSPLQATVHTDEYSKSTVKVGILALRSEQETTQRWQPLINHLNKVIPSRQFLLVVGNLSKLEQKVVDKEIDFLLTQPSHYVSLAHRYNLSSPLVSMIKNDVLQGMQGYSVFAGVIFTSADRYDINQLSDLKNKLIATPTQKSLGAFQMQAFEMISEGVVKSKKSLNLIEVGLPQPNVVKAVLSKQAEVGFVRSGVLEKMFKDKQLDPKQIKIINQQPQTEFSQLSSTRLYPEWPFASVNSVDKNLIKQVLVALLEVEHKQSLVEELKVAGFTIAKNYRQIDQLLRSLRLSPYDTLESVSFSDVWGHLQNEIIFIMSVMMMLFMLFIAYLFLNNQSLVRAKKTLEVSNKKVQRLSFAIEQALIRIMITDTKGTIKYVNNAVVKQSGYQIDELYGENPRIFASGEDAPSLYKTLWKIIKGGNVWFGTVVNLDKQGKRQVLKSTITPIKDENIITGFLSIQIDVTEEQAKETEIHRLAFYDNLTGLANRSLLEKRIDDEIVELRSQQLSEQKISQHFYLVLINIDRFKIINDALGKTIGDKFLRQFAKRIKTLITGNDLLARLAADEFAILYSITEEAINTKLVLSKIDNIFKSMKGAFMIDGNEIDVLISIGVSAIDDDRVLNVEDVLKSADTALHFAKKNGGNQIQVFNQALAEQAVEKFQIDQELKTALSQQQFILHYQQQVNLAGELTGVEALIRWLHPTKGMISPFKFIPIAEQTNLIIDIGNWVLQEACKKTAASFAKGFKYSLSINISPKQFLEDNFYKQVLAIIEETGVDASYLIFEFTESLFMNDMEYVLEKMSKLREVGIKFSIDDFGTGYSSLSYLKKLPVDEIKIDRSFVQNIETDENDKVLVETILSIAGHMGFDVVIEGIERTEQMTFFSEPPKTNIQGFLHGKPISYDVFYDKWSK